MQNKSLHTSLLLGQQCDNNFLRATENIPCNHLNNVVERDSTKYKRPDMIAYTFDEILTRPHQQQQQEQSSGHLSFATRYNSREKRNMNLHNEFDNNNNHDSNDMPIDKKCSRKIEKKKEDGYAQIAERSSKHHHKVECSNDIHSWRRGIQREEKDNQQPRHRTRYKYPISHQSSKIM